MPPSKKYTIFAVYAWPLPMRSQSRDPEWVRLSQVIYYIKAFPNISNRRRSEQHTWIGQIPTFLLFWLKWPVGPKVFLARTRAESYGLQTRKRREMIQKASRHDVTTDEARGCGKAKTQRQRKARTRRAWSPGRMAKHNHKIMCQSDSSPQNSSTIADNS